MEIKFYKHKETNEIITNLSEKFSDKNYIELKANDTDASTEKHVPVYEKNNNKLIVTVGSVMHPMEEKHYIMWIALVTENNLKIVKLNPGEEAKAVFENTNNATIYAYCNLHGLWMTKIN